MPAKMGRKVGDKSPPIEQNNDTKKKRRRKNEAYEQKEEKLEVIGWMFFDGFFGSNLNLNVT
eukprot:1326369-Amorphochlora_amoeboformis.AAC.2